MKLGDLIYIPQDVVLFDSENIFIDKTERPIVGVFIEETPECRRFQSGTCTIYAQGRKTTVSRHCVYPMESPC